MRTLHRLKLMSSPSLSDLGRSERSALDDRNNQQHRAGTNATWNSVCVFVCVKTILCFCSYTHTQTHTHTSGWRTMNV
uniref:Uncharacterized protein n=1 Tax=Sinocyclocheilus anshuiensis TaxID=1608454 RepID=A0A671MM71_9TELE